MASANAPWGHSKGLLAWNDAGEGFVMQVSTPSWPGSGTSSIKRKAGNTLGCISSNNNLLASQHFFALKLNKTDLVKVLTATKSACLVTDPTKLQLVRNGAPTASSISKAGCRHRIAERVRTGAAGCSSCSTTRRWPTASPI